MANENATFEYNLSKKVTEALESVPLVGKAINNFDVAVCNVTGDTFGLTSSGCRAKRDVVAGRDGARGSSR